MALQELGRWLGKLASRQAKSGMLPSLLDSHNKLPCIDGTRMLHWKRRFCQTLLVLMSLWSQPTRLVTNLGAIPSRFNDSGLRSRYEAVYALTLQIHGKLSSRFARNLAQAQPASGCASPCQTVFAGMYLWTRLKNLQGSDLSQVRFPPIFSAVRRQPQAVAKPFDESSWGLGTRL